jgi:type IV pilus assembly protein PilN
MIRVNLLPVPKARKVQRTIEVQYQLVFAGLVVVFVLVICGTLWVAQSGRIKILLADKARAEKELAALKEQVKEVESYEKNKKSLEEKNQIIEQLRRNQRGPVELLDRVGQSMEKLKIWFTLVTLQSGSIEIEGRAVSNSDVVDFVNNLKNTRLFKEIHLMESKQATEGALAIYTFKLKCSLAG